MDPEALRLSNAVWWGGYGRKLANFFRLAKRILAIISLLYFFFNSRFGQDNDIKKRGKLGIFVSYLVEFGFWTVPVRYDSVLLVPNSGLYCLLSPSIAVVWVCTTPFPKPLFAIIFVNLPWCKITFDF